MKWNGLFLFVVLLLFLFSVSLYSEVVLTDEEYDQVMTALNNSEKELIQQKKQIVKLEESLTRLKELQELSTVIINLQRTEFELLKTSFQMLKTDSLIHDLKMFGIGVLSGGLVGTGAGIKIGLQL